MNESFGGKVMTVQISRVFNLTLAILAIVSCGPEHGIKNSSPPMQDKWANLKVVPLNQAATYPLSDGECVNSEDSPAIQVLNFSQTDASPGSVVKFPFWTLQSSPTLTSIAVQSSYYERQSERFCESSFLEICKDETGGPALWQIGPPRNLKVCLPEGEYERRSIEGIGLLVHHHIEQASVAFRRARVPEIVAPKVTLEVMPSFVSNFLSAQPNSKDQSILVDNLAFMFLDGQSTIAVFPENIITHEKVVREAGAHVWEPSFTVAHEYCHAIQAQLVPPTQSLLMDFEVLEGLVQADPPALTLQGQKNKLFTAVSEATADLCSLYLNRGNIDSLRSLSGFYFDRSPYEDQFNDRVTLKILNPQILEFFFTGCKTSACAAFVQHVPINFRDPHLLGAILARGTEQMLEQLVTSKDMDSEDRNHQKLRWTLELYKDFAAQLSHESSFFGVRELQAYSLALSGVIRDTLAPLPALNATRLRGELRNLESEYFNGMLRLDLDR